MSRSLKLASLFFSSITSLCHWQIMFRIVSVYIDNKSVNMFININRQYFDNTHNLTTTCPIYIYISYKVHFFVRHIRLWCVQLKPQPCDPRKKILKIPKGNQNPYRRRTDNTMASASLKMYFGQRFHTPMKLQKNAFNS
jgi:hypothetical protein